MTARRFSMLSLKVFDAVGRLGYSQAVAKELRLPVPQVMELLGQFEAEFSVPLVERHEEHLRLTVAGARLHERVRQSFAQMRTALGQLRNEERMVMDVTAQGTGTGQRSDKVAAVRDGRVRLQMPGDMGLGWLEPRRSALAKALPGLMLELSPGADDDAHLVLHAGEPPKGMMAVSTAVFASNLVAVAKPGVLQEGRGFNDVHLLHDDRDAWVTYITDVMGMERPERLGGKRFDTSEASLSAALAGQGVCLAEAHAVRRPLIAGHLERVDPGVLRSGDMYRLSGPATHLSRKPVRALIDWIVEEARTERLRNAARAQAKSNAQAG